MNFQKKTVIITGAASGMGLLCAKCFAEQGANVVMLEINQATLQARVDELAGQGYRVIGIPVDVRTYP